HIGATPETVGVRVARRAPTRPRTINAGKRESKTRFGRSFKETLFVGVCRSAPCAVCCSAGGHLRRSGTPGWPCVCGQVSLVGLTGAGLLPAHCCRSQRTDRSRRWVSSRVLAPDVRSRLTCEEGQFLRSGLGFLVLPSSDFHPRGLPSHHVQTASPKLLGYWIR